MAKYLCIGPTDRTRIRDRCCCEACFRARWPNSPAVPLCGPHGHCEVPETVTQEAERLIHGDRNDDYGHPLQDFDRVGRLWAAILGLDEVTAEQVGLCLIGLKLARYCHKPKRDSLVDIAGYAGTLEMIARKRTEEGDPS